MSAKRLAKQLDGLFINSDEHALAEEATPALPVLKKELSKSAGPLMADPGSQMSLITFRLGRQAYAMPIEPIRQIIEMDAGTPLLHMKESMMGVINVRGSAVPVVNLRQHFKMPHAPEDLDPHIILVQIGAWMTGLVVDRVVDVLSSRSDQVIRIPDILPDGLGESPMLQGLVHAFDETILLLNLDKLFLPHQRLALARAASLIAEEE